MNDDVRPSAWVRRFPVAGGLLLLDLRSNRLLAYNDTACFAWELIEAGQSAEDVAAEFERAWDIPRSRAQADVASILTQWRQQGLIGAAGERSAPSETGTTVDGYPAAPARWAHEWVSTIAGTPIAFALETDVPSVRLFLANLKTPHARPQTTIEIRGTPSTEGVLIRDGVERMRTSDRGLLIGSLWHAVLETIHPDVDWRALIHGAALARGDAGLALVGPSGSGKTTLAAGLVNRGFDYLCDDTVPVSEPNGEIVPWPLPLSIKPGSVELLASRFPELRDAPAYPVKGMGIEVRLLIPAARVWDAPPVKLRSLIFPRFVAGAAPEQRKLSPFEALQNLLGDRIWLGYPISEARVTSLLGWLDDMPAYAITYGTLDDAVALVERTIA